MMKRQVSTQVTLGGLLILCASSAGVATTIIDFEEWAGGYAVARTFSSRGFVLTNSTHMQVIQDPPDGSRDGTVVLRNFENNEIVLTQADGAPFALLAVDLGEGKTEAPSTKIDLVGFKAGGGVVSTTIALDGILPAFQTAQIERFDGVVRVSLRGDSLAGFSLDNLVVPEPLSGSLMLFGMVVELWQGRRRSYRCRGSRVDNGSITCFRED